LHSHLERKVTCAPVLVALGLSPNFKSSYPSFPERVGLKGDRQDRPAARRVLSGARGAPAGRSCASSSSGSGSPPGPVPAGRRIRTSAFRNQIRWPRRRRCTQVLLRASRASERLPRLCKLYRPCGQASDRGLSAQE